MKKTPPSIYLYDSYIARMELASAIAKIQNAAKELSRDDLPIDEKFAIAWGLGFVELQKLEEYRCIK